MADETVAETITNVQEKSWLIKPGQVLNPAGRPVGSRNKLGEAFVADIYNDWKINGVETIEKVRREKPDAYMKVIASILPKEVNIKQLDDISDDELIARIRQLEHIVRPFLAKEIEGDVVKHEA